MTLLEDLEAAATDLEPHWPARAARLRAHAERLREALNGRGGPVLKAMRILNNGPIPR